MRDLVSLLPMADETVVVQMSGADLLLALENGVSQYPRLDGRWPCISHMRFAFDPEQPAGKRVIAGSVYVASAAAASAAARRYKAAEAAAAQSAAAPAAKAKKEKKDKAKPAKALLAPAAAEAAVDVSAADEGVPAGYVPLDMTAHYTVATKEYLSHGKDGYTSFKRSTVVVEAEQAPLLPGLVRNHFVERAAAAGFRAQGVLSPAKLAKARSVTQRSSSLVPGSAHRLASSVAVAGAAASPSAATPLAPSSADNIQHADQHFVTPSPAAAKRVLPALGTSSMTSPGAKASPDGRFSSADHMSCAIGPEVEGRIRQIVTGAATQ